MAEDIKTGSYTAVNKKLTLDRWMFNWIRKYEVREDEIASITKTGCSEEYGFLPSHLAQGDPKS